MKIASLCDVYEVNCAPHNFYGNLCSMISATFCACIPNFRVMEIDIDSVAWRDEFTPPPVIENGELVMPTGPGWGVEVNEAAIRARPPQIGGRYSTMAKYRIVTPAGASFTTAGGGYALESEALAGMDAEIVEAPTDEAGFIAAARDADAIYGKGIAITKEIIDALENCKVITLGSVGVDSVDVKAATARGIPGDQRPRHLHRGSRRPRHDAAAGRLPPAAGAGPHGARGPLEGRPPGAAENPAADGP